MHYITIFQGWPANSQSIVFTAKMSSKVVVKWSGTEYDIEVLEDETVLHLKQKIFVTTQVRPDRQKLLNLKHNGKSAADDVLISALNLKPGFKIMMMGSREETIVEATTKPEDLPEVVDDFDIPDEADVEVKDRKIFLEKVERRVRDYTAKIFNEPREGKKLLVLDIDYTLFDHRSTGETGSELMRPYLHEFLTDSYEVSMSTVSQCYNSHFTLSPQSSPTSRQPNV